MFGLQIRSTKWVSTALTLVLSASALSLATPAQADYRPPVITTTNPASGTITGGDLVTVTGQNLQYVTGGKLGASDLDFGHGWKSVASDGTWLKFLSPNSAVTGLVDLTLYSEVNVTAPKVYTYLPTKITSITPNKSTTDGGIKVNIKGVGFGPMVWTDSSLSVRIGSGYATDVVRVSPTEITAVAPAGAAGNVDVVVSFNNVLNLHYSDNVITGTKLYTYAPVTPAPTITSISPKIGPAAGGNDVTIVGTALKTLTANGVFTFDGLTATVVSVNSGGTSAVVKAPAHALGAVDVKVTTANGSATKTGAYEYVSQPTISSVTPNGGVAEGGTFVTISGTNFGGSGSPVVKIAGKLALCTTLVNSTTITAVTRENAAGAADVAVTSSNGSGTATLTGGYTYAAATAHPAIDSVTPNSGSTAGGNSVDIHTSDTFPAGVPNVLFGQVCSISVTRVDDHTIRAIAPAGSAGAKNLSLTFPSAYSISANGYTYVAPVPASITSVTPTEGFTVGGTNITIVGTGFGDSGTPAVTVGGVAATNIVRVDSTHITATTPASTTIGAKPVVVTPVSQSAITKTNAFTYRAPIITSVTPNSGLALGGTPVTIQGDGFGSTGTPVVTFGGVAATNIVRVNETTITASTPAGTLGDVAVAVTPEGASLISKAAAYTYVSSNLTPLIYNSTPTTGPATGGITLTVTGDHFRGTTGSTVVTVGGLAVTNLVINAEGTSLTFTVPALSPGNYDISITTNKGRAWRALYTVLAPPSITENCETATSTQTLNPDGGTNVTIYGERFGLGTGTPVVKIGGVEVTVTETGNIGTPRFKDYVEFTDPGGALGYVSAEIIPADNSGTVSLSDCLRRIAGGATIEANDKTIYFGENPGEFTWFATGERGTDNVSAVTLMFDGNGYGPSVTPPTASGSYGIRISNGVMNPGNIADYNFSYIDGTFTILGYPATVTAEDKEKIYGDADPDFTHLVTGLQDGETEASVVLTFSGTDTAGNGYGPSTTPPTNAGTYTIRPSAETLVSGNEDLYSFGYFDGDYIIHKRPVTIVSVDQSKIYGYDDPSFPWEFLDPAHPNLAYADTLSGDLDRVSGENVGVYAQTIGTMADDNPNYEITYTDSEGSLLGDLSINKRHITVTADDKTKMYGTADPELTYSSAGFVGDDTVLIGALSRDDDQNAGTHAITQGTLEASGNYVIDTFNPGILTIEKRPVQITPYGREKVYGDNDPASLSEGVGSGYYISGDYGLVYEDTFSGTLSRDTGENVGDYTINQGTVALSANYDLSYVSGNTLKINPRPIHLTATDVSKTYGDTDVTPFAYSVVSGEGYYDLINGDVISGDATRNEGENVGSYDITVGTLSAGSNYSLSFDSGQLTIDKLDVTVTPDDDSKVYGADDPIFTYSASPSSLPFGDSLSGTLTRVGGEDAGPYTINGGDFSNSPNYNVTVNTGTFTINPLDITVTAEDKSKQYGDLEPSFTYTTSPTLPNGDELTGSLERVDTSENVGDYTITQGTIVGGTNYNITTFNSGTLTINVRNIEFIADDQAVYYGDLLPDATDSLTGHLSDTSELAFSDAIDGFTYFAYGVPTPVNVGTYSITPGDLNFTSGDALNYNITYTDGTLTINKLAIDLTANDAQKDYGQDDPTFDYTTSVTPLPYGDMLAGSLSRDAGNDVSTYAIRIGDLNDQNTNYDITVIGGQLTINPLAVSVDPGSPSKNYGDDDPELTFTTTPASLPYDDVLSGTLSRETGEDVGSYGITVGNVDTSNANYVVTLTPGNLTINPLDITVTAENKSKQYGDSDPEFTFTTNPALLNGDVLSGELARVDTSENVGSYTIEQGTVVSGSNYNITSYNYAMLDINVREIEFIADDYEINYGDPLPDSISSLTGRLANGSSLANDDTIGGATFTYGVPTPVDAGTYSITPGDLVFTSGSSYNYNITYTAGELAINKVQIGLTVDALEKTYGEADPDFIYRISSGALVNGDTELTGTLDREPGSDVGEYNITIGNLTENNPNYDVSVYSGILTINPVDITVTADDQGKTFGDTEPSLTYDITVGALTNGDTSLAGTLGRTAGEDVGDYPINVGDLDTSNGNYNITFEPGTFTIAEFDLEVTINDDEKYYGDDDPVIDFTFNPATLGDGSPITLDGASEREPGQVLGEYAVSRGTLGGGTNFNVTSFTGGTLTIVPRPLHVKAADKNVVWGETVPGNSYDFIDGTSLAFDDEIDGVTYVTAGTAPRHVDNYPITPSDIVFGSGDASNYDITYSDGLLTVDPADLTITIADVSTNWGEAAPTFTTRSVVGLANEDELGEIEYTVDTSSTVPVDPGIYDLDGTMATLTSPGEISDYNVNIVPAQYIINGPASIAMFPNSGPTEGGTEFTIYGSGFGFTDPEVTLDGLDATDVVLVDSNTITGVTPAHERGPVDVKVTTDQGEVDLGEIYTYVPPTPTPSILMVYPDVVTLGGGTTVTIIGDNLCELDGTKAQIKIGTRVITGATVSSDCKSLTFKTPSAKKAGRVTFLVSNGGGLSTYGPGLTYKGKKKSKQMTTHVLFKGDSPKLTSKGKMALRKIAKKAKKKANLEISVYGWVHHVKGQSLKKDVTFRKWLAKKRATNVAAYLKKLGVKGKYVAKGKGIHSYGNYKDRRAEIVIVYDEPSK